MYDINLDRILMICKPSLFLYDIVCSSNTLLYGRTYIFPFSFYTLIWGIIVETKNGMDICIFNQAPASKDMQELLRITL